MGGCEESTRPVAQIFLATTPLVRISSVTKCASEHDENSLISNERPTFSGSGSASEKSATPSELLRTLCGQSLLVFRPTPFRSTHTPVTGLPLVPLSSNR